MFRSLAMFVALTCASALTAAETAEVQTLPKEKDQAEKKVKMVDITLARGGLQLRVPKSWNAKKPRVRFIEHEFAVPAVKGDKTPGRITMMRSGGSLKQNIDRWIGQFSQADGKSTKDVAKIKKKKVNDQEVTLVDISGTFNESIGPPIAGKSVARENYRMLGGIVQTKKHGQYFFKLYGPKKTIKGAEKHFQQMMESVSAAKKKD